MKSTQLIDLEKYPINDFYYQEWKRISSPETDLLKELPLLLAKQDMMNRAFHKYLAWHMKNSFIVITNF